MTSVSSVLATAPGGTHINIKPCINRIEVCAFVCPHELMGCKCFKKKRLFCRNSPFIPEYKRNSKSTERLTVADFHISFVSDSRPVNICSLSVWCPSEGLFNVQARLDNKKKPVGTLNKARPSAGAWNNKQTPRIQCLRPPLLAQSLFTGSRLNTGN